VRLFSSDSSIKIWFRSSVIRCRCRDVWSSRVFIALRSRDATTIITNPFFKEISWHQMSNFHLRHWHSTDQWATGRSRLFFTLRPPETKPFSFTSQTSERESRRSPSKNGKTNITYLCKTVTAQMKKCQRLTVRLHQLKIIIKCRGFQTNITTARAMYF
jgi:hypothetical protein